MYGPYKSQSINSKIPKALLLLEGKESRDFLACKQIVQDLSLEFLATLKDDFPKNLFITKFEGCPNRICHNLFESEMTLEHANNEDTCKGL